MVNQKGQVVLILILVMTVALGIGVSVVQRSLSDVSTASKVEQSSRAFSAAEAGIEKAIQASGSPVPNFTLDSNSTSVNTISVPVSGQALEYPPIAKEEMAQVWLANPTSTSNPPTAVYTGSNLNVYFGTPDTTDKPAIEVNVISWDGTGYVSTKRFFDADSGRASVNDFSSATCNDPTVLTNANTANSKFYCMATITGYPYASPAEPILVRIRLLYSSTSQPVAVAPVSGSLPTQANIFTATGTSGQTQRKVQVFRLDKVVPSFFDYAIFSAGQINK